MPALKKRERLWLFSAFMLMSVNAFSKPFFQHPDTLLKQAQRIYSKQPGLAIILSKKAYYEAQKQNNKIGEVKSLKSLAKLYFYSRKFDSVKLYCNTALSIMDKFPIDSLTGDTWLILGALNQSTGNYQQAINKYQTAIPFYKRQNKTINLAKDYLNIGICKQQLSQYFDAIKDYLFAVTIFENLNDKENLANTFNSIALCFVSLNNYPKAIEYNKKALDIRLNLKDTSLVAQSFSNIGFAFKENNQPDSALYYLRKSLAMQKQEKDPLLLVNSLQNIGSAYKAKKELALAEKYIKRSIDTATTLKMQQELAQGYFELCKILIDEKKYDPALAAANITENTAKILKINKLLMNAYSVKYQLYLKKNDYKSALYYENEKDKLKDSIFSLAKDKAINELEVKYQTSLKEKDIATLNLQNKLQNKTVAQQRLSIIFLVIGALLLALLGSLAYSSYRQKNKDNIRIQNLMQELHHRVKNNLQILSGLFTMQIENLNDEASKNALRENETRLASMNLIHNKLYLDHGNTKIEMDDYLTKLLQHIKNSFGGERGKNISLRLEVEPISVEADKAVAIGLIVNELATNAFKYAFNGETGEIYLSLKQEGESKILLSLRDNGKGIKKENQSKEISFGLKLVNLMARQLHSKLISENNNGAFYQMEIDV